MFAGTKVKNPTATREKLIDAATATMRRQGYCATTVDQICVEAGVTKGAFFHYFGSKEDLAVATVEAWCREGVYRADLGEAGNDPLVRLDCLFVGLIASVRNPGDEPLACLLGMVAQELGHSGGRLREVCSDGLEGWTALVSRLLRAAKEAHPVRMEFDPDALAWTLNALWQGSLLVAKTRGDPEIAANNLRQARAHVKRLFDPHPPGPGAAVRRMSSAGSESVPSDSDIGEGGSLP